MLSPDAFMMVGAPIVNQNTYGLGFRKFAIIPFLMTLTCTFVSEGEPLNEKLSKARYIRKRLHPKAMTPST